MTNIVLILKLKFSGRRKNVPGLIGKLRYKDDTINFIFCEKIWVFKFISIKVPWNLYKIKNATNVLSKKLKFLYMNSNREKFFWVYWINSVCIQKFCIYHVIKWHLIKNGINVNLLFYLIEHILHYFYCMHIIIIF